MGAANRVATRGVAKGISNEGKHAEWTSGREPLAAYVPAAVHLGFEIWDLRLSKSRSLRSSRQSRTITRHASCPCVDTFERLVPIQNSKSKIQNRHRHAPSP